MVAGEGMHLSGTVPAVLAAGTLAETAATIREMATVVTGTTNSGTRRMSSERGETVLKHIEAGKLTGSATIPEKESDTVSHHLHIPRSLTRPLPLHPRRLHPQSLPIRIPCHCPQLGAGTLLTSGSRWATNSATNIS